MRLPTSRWLARSASNTMKWPPAISHSSLARCFALAPLRGGATALFKRNRQIAVVVGGVDGRKIELDDQLVNIRGRDAIARHFPVPIKAAAQRADATVLDAVIFRQYLVSFAKAIDGPAVQSQLFKQVLDERTPRRQADGHGHACADKQDCAPPADCLGKNVPGIRALSRDGESRYPVRDVPPRNVRTGAFQGSSCPRQSISCATRHS